MIRRDVDWLRYFVGIWSARIRKPNEWANVVKTITSERQSKLNHKIAIKIDEKEIYLNIIAMFNFELSAVYLLKFPDFLRCFFILSLILSISTIFFFTWLTVFNLGSRMNVNWSEFICHAWYKDGQLDGVHIISCFKQTILCASNVQMSGCNY